MTCCASDHAQQLEEIVTFESREATLEGTLNLPGGERTFPLAIFIHGSGKRTRDDFRQFVPAFNNIGIATFRYDKRGVGKSGGTYTDVGTLDSETIFPILAEDAVAAIHKLKKDPRINAQKIIVVGVSQAGWIIPEINTMTDIALSVCISGPFVSVGEEIYYSDLAETGSFTQEYADKMLPTYRGPRGFDPSTRLIKMNSPSLWIFGSRDVSIPIKRSLFVFDSLKTQYKLPMEMKLFAGADHGMHNAGEHRAENVSALITEWLKEKIQK